MPVSKLRMKSLKAVKLIVSILESSYHITCTLLEQLITMKGNGGDNFFLLFTTRAGDIVVLIFHKQLCHFSCNVRIEEFHSETALKKTIFIN